MARKILNENIKSLKEKASQYGVTFNKEPKKYSVGMVELKDKEIADKMPDIYEFLADINNDEIKTPPTIAKAMIDLLPKELFSSKDSTFLDPCVKSGVFLREIIKRLNEGLKKQIPDVCERISHILKKQIFGVSMMEMGALLARRSIYCSREANDPLRTCAISSYDVSGEKTPKMSFDTPEGNILFKRCLHNFKKGRCTICGAKEETFGEKATTILNDQGKPKEDRKGNIIKKENHAYPFIHVQDPKTIFNMKFDVIIGNPPYQLNDQDTNSENNNSSSASPIYNKFVEQAKKLNPRYLVMIIPSRWMSGGKGLDMFRSSMKDKHLTVVHDFMDHKDCFPNAFIVGGVMYFLWESDKTTTITKWFSHALGRIVESDRDISNDTKIIRENDASLLKDKILKNKTKTFDEIVLEHKPYGLRSSFRDFSKEPIKGGIKLYYNEKAQLQEGWLPKKYKLTKGANLLSEYKVLISKAIYTSFAGQSKYGLKPFISKPNSVSTETYLVIKSKNEQEAKNIISYMKTNFFYFLLSIAKLSHNTSKKDFAFIPMQDFSKKWTDDELNKLYALSDDDLEIIKRYAPKNEKE